VYKLQDQLLLVLDPERAVECAGDADRKVN